MGAASWARELRQSAPEDNHVIKRACSGNRCRITRHVQYPTGAIHRHTHGTIRYVMENIGRELVVVDWDIGRSTVVFPNDIELLDSVSPQASA